MGKDVEVCLLAPGIRRHVSYQRFEEKWKEPANGLVVVGRHHVDCQGGLPAIHQRGIVSYGPGKTRELELYYPGPELIENTMKLLTEKSE